MFFFPFLRKVIVINFLRLFSIILLVKQLLATFAKSFAITKVTTLNISFSMLFGPRAFPFRRLLINLLIFFPKIVGLIISAL